MTEEKGQKMHYVVATVIVVRNEKYLITKRAEWEKAFPGKWTVPGGKLEPKDYVSREKDAGDLWYNVIEDLARREVLEETGLEVGHLNYLTSLSYIRPDQMPCVIISLFADHANGEVKLCNALTEHAWVGISEAKEYELIDGIFDELKMLDSFINTGKMREKWERAH